MLIQKNKVKTLYYTLMAGMAIGAAGVKLFSKNQDKIKSDLNQAKQGVKGKVEDTYSISKNKLEEWVDKLDKIFMRTKLENRGAIDTIKEELQTLTQNSNEGLKEGIQETKKSSSKLKDELIESV